MTIALYELTQGYKALLDLESTDEDILGALDQLGDAIDAKAEGIAKVLRSLEAEADAMKAEARRFSDAAQARTNRAASLKRYLMANLQAAGLKRAGGMLYVTVQASPPSAKVVDEYAVSEEEGYKERVWTWNFNSRKAIEDWKATGQAPAGFGVSQGQHLVVRP